MQVPKEFEEYTKALMGEELYATLSQALEAEPPVSIRLNPYAPMASVPSATPVPWSRYGYYLEERPNFTFDPLLHSGCYYVQEASSMFTEHVLRTLLHHPSSLTPSFSKDYLENSNKIRTFAENY